MRTEVEAVASAITMFWFSRPAVVRAVRELTTGVPDVPLLLAISVQPPPLEVMSQ